MKTTFFTREYPPAVYGGAGVHVEYLARELAKRIDLEVRCFGEPRTTPGVNAYQPWEALGNGLPQEQAFESVLRDALTTDTHASAGVYFGTTTGQVYCSADEGETWRALPARLPPVYSVAAIPIQD